MAYLQRAIPRARAQRHAVCADAEARDTVLVAGENTDTFALERVPDIARPVIIATE